MTTIPKPRDVTEILRGVANHEDPWKDPTLGTLLHRAADEIERLRGQIARAAEIVRIKDDLITEMQRRLIAHDLKVPKPKEPTL